jgi:type IV fimbrial biogenesis protein FimT
MTGKESGLTLIELLIVLAIIGIISTTVTPYFKGIVVHVRSYSALHSLRTSLILARSEAIKRNSTVRVCASIDTVSCSKSNQWSTGWIVYVPKVGDIYLNPGDTVIGHSDTVTGVSIIKNGRETTLKFNARGSIGLNRSFSICSDPENKPISRLVVYRTGRVRMTEGKIECLG